MPETIRGSKPQKVGLLCSCLLLSVTLGLFAPIETYLVMTESLWFPFVDLLLVTLCVTAVLFALTFGVGLLTRGRLRYVYMALMVAASALLYLQSQFLNADYGVLNGRTIHWDAFGAYPVWNTLLWAAILAAAITLALVKKEKLLGALRFASVLLMVIEAVSAGMLLVSTDLSGKGANNYFSTKNEFSFSRNQNVVVVAIDSVTPQMFDEVKTLYPEAFEDWTGFVEFPNNTGVFPATENSMCNLLTGSAHSPTQRWSDYLQSAYESCDFWSTLKQNGYDTECYVNEALSPACEEAFDNYVADTLHVTNGFTLFKKMYRLTGFRYAPHVAKRFFWMNSADFEELKRDAYDDLFVRDDIAFRRRLDDVGVTVDMDRNCFRCYFMWGGHLQYVMDTPTSHVQYYVEAVTQHRQLLSVFDTVTTLLNGMKAQGIYDDATIIIMADHGDQILANEPFLLVKKPGATGPITQNMSFVNQNDFQATVYALAGIDATSDIGMNVFDVGDLKRTFTYHYLPFKKDYAYLYDLTMLQNGELHYEQRPVWYDAEGEQPIETARVQVGERYAIARPDDMLRLLNHNDADRVYARGDDSVWLCAKRGITLRAELNEVPANGVRVELSLTDVMNGAQRVVVARGDAVYQTLQATSGMQSLAFDVPVECVTDGRLVVELRFPDAMSEFAQSGYQEAYVGYYAQAIAVDGIAFTAR